MTDIGRHIVIYGATGAGKTTLSHRLAAALGIGVIELDGMRHARGWDSVPWEEMREMLQQSIDAHPEGWVAEGNYSRVTDIVLSRADTVLWLDLPWRVSFWRLFGRTVTRGLKRYELYGPGGPRESLLMALTPRSILWWSISHHQAHGRSTRAHLADAPASARIVILKKASEVEAFAREVEAAARERAGDRESTSSP